jgi:hypothetical protein
MTERPDVGAGKPTIEVTKGVLAGISGDGAVLSACGIYRYILTRETGEADTRLLLWVMLNPSTVDATKDDPTIRKVVGFTRRAGYGMAGVVNLFGFRATKPADLKRAVKNHGLGFAGGPDNWRAITVVAAMSDAIVCAWGAEPIAQERGHAARAFLSSRGKPLLCLGTTKEGAPLHPLMPSYDGHPLVPFGRAA